MRELERYESGVPLTELDLGGASFIPSANDPDWTRDTSFFSTVLAFEQRPTEAWGYSVNYQNLTSRRKFLDGPGGVSVEPLGTTRLDFDGRIDTLN